MKLPLAGRFERILEVLDVRLARTGGPDDRDHIETRSDIEQPVPSRIRQCRAGDSLLLFEVDRLGRQTPLVARARFDFDKDYRPPVDGNQVQFTPASAATTGDDLITPPLEIPGRRILATPGKRVIATTREKAGNLFSPGVPEVHSLLPGQRYET